MSPDVFLGFLVLLGIVMISVYFLYDPCCRAIDRYHSWRIRRASQANRFDKLENDINALRALQNNTYLYSTKLFDLHAKQIANLEKAITPAITPPTKRTSKRKDGGHARN